MPHYSKTCKGHTEVMLTIMGMLAKETATLKIASVLLM